jgi:hypothetical protein
MKQKVVNDNLPLKDSETFPKWMKYEVTLMSENGTTETIPAVWQRSSGCPITCGSRSEGR